MKKLSLIIVLCIGCIFMSCNNADEPAATIQKETKFESRSTLAVDSVVLVDSYGNIFQNSEAQVPSLNKIDQTFSTYSSDNVTNLVGYTSKEYIKSDVMVFSSQPMDNRLSAWVYYIEDYYTYIYKITVPHGYTVTVPTTFDSSWATGMKPSDQSQNGYELVGPLTTSTNGDTYEMRTIIREISHNSSGQYLGFTAYLPFRVGNPSTDLLFKYVAIKIEW